MTLPSGAGRLISLFDTNTRVPVAYFVLLVHRTNPLPSTTKTL
ncbi:hypothetical protein J538_2985 [Acinetobacter sp. 272263]|nr:hypothetical protein J538_2985 [Acinetobacter sp. 272263]